MAKKDRRIVVLDIGSTKTCALVALQTAEQTENSDIEIIGIGVSPSKGLRKGVVVNIDATVESVKRAIEDAETMANMEIRSAVVGIAGAHISGFNSEGIVAIKNKEVQRDDVERVLEAARAVAIPLDREVIHIIPQEFIIDDQDGVKDPVGMCGVRLEAKVHIITGAVTSAQNIIKCANRTGLTVADIVLQPIASAEAVLSEEEKELGVALLDIGGGTTDLVIYHEGSLRYTNIMAVGGNHITNDIAIGLRTPGAEAENIKKQHGGAMSSLISNDETIEVPSVGGRGPRTVLRQILCDIIEPRIEEIFSLTKREIVKAGYEDMLAAGVVLTGGTALLPGIVELGEKVFELPVRKGTPTGIRGTSDAIHSPAYATPVGLIKYAIKNQMGGHLNPLCAQDTNLVASVKRRVGGWFKELF